MCAEFPAKGFLYFGIMNWTRANLHGTHKTRQTEHSSLICIKFNWILIPSVPHFWQRKVDDSIESIIRPL